jgi:hypothetical protein
MLTPKQSRLLQSLDPEILAMLDLVPVPSHEYKTNLAIQARVNAWIEEARNLPVVKRTLTKMMADRLPWEIIDPSALPVSVRTCRAWACMAGKTISSPF